MLCWVLQDTGAGKDISPYLHRFNNKKRAPAVSLGDVFLGEKITVTKASLLRFAYVNNVEISMTGVYYSPNAHGTTQFTSIPRFNYYIWNEKDKCLHPKNAETNKIFEPYTKTDEQDLTYANFNEWRKDPIMIEAFQASGTRGIRLSRYTIFTMSVSPTLSRQLRDKGILYGKITRLANLKWKSWTRKAFPAHSAKRPSTEIGPII
ncbi:hypothetical protein TRVA0_049S01046 [Trichomonascus vanleenenianus]|uniref:uncharacterized protein n=1 Tax=Trichomonascus vanleenenianus TaxID=2268995 RepID=UPI003EC9D73B